MKVKCDFVTNSSSTSYVCIIPKSFNIREHLTLEKVNEYDDCGLDREPTNEDLEALITEFESVRQGKTLWGYNYGGSDIDALSYRVFKSLAADKKFVIEYVDGSSDDDKIIFLDPKKVKEFLDK